MRPGLGRRTVVLALVGLLVLPGAAPPGGSSSEPRASEREYQVKAAAVYHFIRYTTWPSSSFTGERDPIRVLVVGDNPFGKHLEAALADKVIGRRTTRITYSKQVPERVEGHFVLAGELDEQDRGRLLAACQGKATFLFGNQPGFARSGACGNFYLDDGRVHFELNVDALERARLEVSSELLKLARIVHTEGTAEALSPRPEQRR